MPETSERKRSRDETTFVGRRIGAQLRRMREERGITREKVGIKGISVQTLWRLESGQGPFRDLYIRGLCSRYGANEERLQKLLTMAERWDHESWWEPYGTKHGMLFDVELEARRIIVVAPNLVHGLIQTPATTRPSARSPALMNHFP